MGIFLPYLLYFNNKFFTYTINSNDNDDFLL